MLTRRFLSGSGDGSAVPFVALLLAVTVAIPVLNLLVPESSPLHVSTYVLTLVGKYLCFAMLALAFFHLPESAMHGAVEHAPAHP